MRLAKPSVVRPIRDLVNNSLVLSEFPDDCKRAMVVPIYTKNSTLDQSNFRPVSILPIISKFFENVINEQVVELFNQHFNIYVSAFRPGFGCQSTPLRSIEEWKSALDENKYVAAILTYTNGPD